VVSVNTPPLASIATTKPKRTRTKKPNNDVYETANSAASEPSALDPAALQSRTSEVLSILNNGNFLQVSARARVCEPE
jgi:hypothetical protein